MTESEQRRFEVILEDISGKFGLVLEGHEAIRKEFNGQLDALRKKQDLFESLLKSSHDSLTQEIRTVDKRSEEWDAELEARLTAEIRAVGEKACLCRHGRQVDGHEARISTLERKVA